MVFSSLSFLFLFLPALLAVYYLVPRRYREGRNAVLLLFSLGFYGCGGWRLLPLILVSIIMNYVFGRLAAPGRRRRKTALAAAVACNLGLLFVFKYLGFVTANLHALLPSVPELTILLPIGISFYTFQAMSYVIDVYRGDAAAEKSFLHVALYVVLFPQLVAGPIVRYSTVAEEIRCRRESADDMAEGLQRFLFGLAKKVLLANQMGLIADAAFSQTAPRLSMGLAWLGVIGYTLQIYFDFSGYSDMAIGLGRVFGFHFLENFNYPYVSRHGVLAALAHLPFHLVPGLPLHPTGREPGLTRQADPEPPHRLGPYGLLARGGVELPLLGALLCPAIDGGAVRLGPGLGADAGRAAAHGHHAPCDAGLAPLPGVRHGADQALPPGHGGRGGGRPLDQPGELPSAAVLAGAAGGAHRLPAGGPLAAEKAFGKG